jgi:hypothetical protein
LRFDFNLVFLICLSYLAVAVGERGEKFTLRVLFVSAFSIFDSPVIFLFNFLWHIYRFVSPNARKSHFGLLICAFIPNSEPIL